MAAPLTFLQAAPGRSSDSRLPRRYWQSQGPKPDEETVEGTVIPGALLGSLALYASIYPLTNGAPRRFKDLKDILKTS